MNAMEVSCPNCYAIYPIKPEKIPDKGATPTCRKCGNAFTIVKATGDPVKDRAQRMKGYVLIRGSQTEETPGNGADFSCKAGLKTPSARSLLVSRNLRNGARVAGILLLIFCSAFFVVKNRVHGKFEKALKGSLIQASNEQFTVNVEKVSFSWFGGLTRDRGCIHGLSLTNHGTRERLELVDKIHFDLQASQKRFISKPFDFHLNGAGARTVIKGCVIEARNEGEAHVTFRADEIYSVMNGIELFTVLGMDLSFRLSAKKGKDRQGVTSGDGAFQIRAREVKVTGEPIIKEADILVAIRNFMLPKGRSGESRAPVSVVNRLYTQWGDQQAVAVLERCSLNVFGSKVGAEGSLEFQNPVEQSKGSLNLSISNMSPMMKSLHRINEKAFDRILLTLVVLDERNAGAYNRAADSLAVSFSYRDSRIRVNNQEIQSLL
jgi:predicted Zn finger-like uncharacterized protein